MIFCNPPSGDTATPRDIRARDSSPAAGYIAEIDGLRAIAVLSVIAFHFREEILPGGFAGVDVFFVISGYVISKSLAATNQPSLIRTLGNFYKRRVLRIGPALILCLSVTAVASTLFVVPSWLSVSNNATGLAAFAGVSNLFLLADADGYFRGRVDFNPYAHTWSLGVEEQFYVIFPALFFVWLSCLGGARKGVLRRTVPQILIPVFAFLSLGLAVYQSTSDPQRAFYLLPSRFWELAAGAMLFQAQARGFMRARPEWMPVLSLAGLLLIGIGFSYADQAGFPFPWALAPVAGTAVLITAAAGPSSAKDPVRRILAAAPIRYIGVLSYSLYLWHWPVLVLMRWTIGIGSATNLLAALASVAALSMASFHLVERPVRRSGMLRRQASWRVVSGGVACAGLGLVLAHQIFAHSGVLVQSKVHRDGGWRSTQIPASARLQVPTVKPLSGRTLFVIGDSHAGAYRAMLQMAWRELGLDYVILRASGCSVANLREPHGETPYCKRFLTWAMTEIESAAKPGDGVFLAALRAYRLSHQGSSVNQERIAALVHGALATQARRRALADAHRLLDRLQGLGLRILIDAPKPTFLAPPFRCMDWFNRANPICAPGFTISRDRLSALNGPVRDSLDRIRSAHPRVKVWDPFPVLCPTDVCSAFIEGRPLFFDGDHLTGYGNAHLYPAFRRTVLDLFLGADRD